MTTTMTQKGQITIPVELRRQFGFKQGSRCMFAVKDGELVIRPIKKDLTLDEIRDLLAEGLPTADEFLKWKREEKKLEYNHSL